MQIITGIYIFIVQHYINKNYVLILEFLGFLEWKKANN